MLQVITITSRQDNYIWLIKKANKAVVVDPGEAEPVLAHLAKLDLELHAILLTHHHHDVSSGADQHSLRQAALCHSVLLHGLY